MTYGFLFSKGCFLNTFAVFYPSIPACHLQHLIYHGLQEYSNTAALSSTVWASAYSPQSRRGRRVVFFFHLPLRRRQMKTIMPLAT